MTSACHAAGSAQVFHSRTFVALVGGLTMLGQFAIVTYLPAFDAIGQALHATPKQVQQSLTAYLLPFAFMMLWHGALSDAFGRRRIILAALLLFTLGSLLCAAAVNIDMFYIGRVVQGLSSGVGLIVGGAMVRDLFDGAQAQKLLALVGMIFALAPALAPLCGGWLLLWTGWRGILVFLAALSALLLLASWWWLPETLPPARRHSLHPVELAKAYAAVFADRKFMAIALANATVSAAIYVYIVGAPSFITRHLGLDAQSFGWLFIPIVAGMLVGGTLAHRIAGRMTPWHCVALGHAVMALAGVINIGINATDLPAFPWALLALPVFTLGMSLTQPSLQMMALDCVPNRRGLAASCYMTLLQVSNTLASALLVPVLVGTTLRMALGVAALQVVGALIFGLALRGRVSDAAHFAKGAKSD
jgi:MFS transporter, DHA1 family, multidrug resistance protein